MNDDVEYELKVLREIATAAAVLVSDLDRTWLKRELYAPLSLCLDQYRALTMPKDQTDAFPPIETR